MSVAVLLLAAAVVTIGALLHIMPGLTRPDIFFAVTVEPKFRRSPDARRIRSRYRIIVWVSTLAAAALEAATGLTPAALIVLAGGLLWALASTHRMALAHAATPTSIVEVDLAARREGLPGGPAVAFLPPASLAALGLWMILRPNTLPSSFPVHWGLNGPDRWVPATPGSVLVFLATMAWLCLFLVAMAWGLSRWSRRITAYGPRGALERRFRRRVLGMMILSEYFLVVPAWAALFQPSAALMNIWGPASLGTILGFSVSLGLLGQGGSHKASAAGAAPTGDRTPDACWKWGLFYVNPADPAVWIEKRFGLGYTLNLGNRWTWALLGVLLVPLPIALVFLR